MFDYEKVAEKFWNLPQKGAEEAVRETLFMDDIIQKSQYILDPSSNDALIQWYAAHAESALADFRIDMPAVWRAWDSGLLEEGEGIRERFAQGETPWPVTYLFMPEELRDILVCCGLVDIRLSGPGAFSRSIPHGVLRRIMNDREAKAEFLQFCYHYDSQPSVAGMGKDNLLAVGKKPEFIRASNCAALSPP